MDRREFLLAAAGLALKPWAGGPTPALALPDLEGREQRLADYRGKVVLVNFWATSCPVCARELPELIATYRTYAPRGFEIIAVAMPYDRPDWVVDYARRRQLPFTVALDFDGTINRAFGGIEATPTAFLIDKRGRIVRRTVGQPDFAELRTRIQRELDREIRS